MGDYLTEEPVDATGVIKRLDEAFVGMEILEDDDREMIVYRLCRWLEVGKYGDHGRDIILAVVKYIDVKVASSGGERVGHA
ncbi:hypothetical protein [Hyphomicrobium sp.]|jgi:hypothetical protein|uniref:hypothetical protein n=1 Tax=Hyphomicrobium sp. TaxID=82 RepID=UPI003565C83F